MYKVPTNVLTSGNEAEKIVRAHYARVLSVESNFTVLEKTGHKEETQALFNELEPFGILEFVRSGRIAITKANEDINLYRGGNGKPNQRTIKMKNYFNTLSLREQLRAIRKMRLVWNCQNLKME